ncbi:DNAJC9 family DNAJ domain-containing protein [Schizosaccharomyces japonicus yFS275]|uniref:DNAJC9 family DNAJ domain-containing protein n=1 Tax=Schizosaccharomyces japonicus (strain yFS275 / FY16936) TaxID=402676 RepID=B6JYK9_SCHJY|nr:DNAJC9 family DNAJ domain-containing protein [Schizosaccharomyces japonicus yFS275]EEB06627.1 DNAJC9 family DNAJ domain-containing protein [Schizosaccharomyces japonicus yFS275]
MSELVLLLPTTMDELEKEEFDLYEVLDLNRDADASLIRRAYRKKALLYHPDRIREEDKKLEARHNFERVALAYSILSDDKKRKRYDETGSLNLDDTEFDWKEWLDEQYGGIVSMEKVEEFKKSYQHSEEEREDVLQAYVDAKGSIDGIIEQVMCSSVEDEPRFREIIEEAINEGKLKRYKAFKASKSEAKRRKRKAKKEAEEAEELARELGLNKKTGSEDSLAAMIRARSSQRMENMISNLEAKYSKPKRSKKA